MAEVILNSLIDHMMSIGQLNISGDRKKNLVLLLIQEELDLPDILEDLIINLIDVLIKVEQNKLKFNKTFVKKKLLFCCNR